VTGAGQLLDWYGAALETVHGREAVRAALADEPPPQRPVHLLALGKAADAMLQGAAAVWETAIVRALVVAPGGAAAEISRLPFPVRRQAGNHPVPGSESLAAGSAVADFLQAVPADDALLVLLSGGASSLAEWPQPGVDLAQLRELNERLLAAGLDIRVMNALRGRFSRLKAGGAAGLCGSTDVLVLFISDVPGDLPASVGSGPFWAPEYADAAIPIPDIGWPELETLLRQLPPAPRAALRPLHRLVAGNDDAREAVRLAAGAEGLDAWDHGLFPEASGLPVARRLVRILRHAPSGVHVWGGEAPVPLPARPGRGGRAQHLAALLLLLWLSRGWPRAIAVLSAATDGVDGNSGAAGAWFRDGCPDADAGMHTALRQALRAADTAAFWEGLGQVVPGRETGTNVMDLLIVRLGPVAPGAGRLPGDIVGQAVPSGAGTGAPGDAMAHQPERATRADPKPSAAASSTRPSPGVHAMALGALQLHDPARKCECVERLLEAWRVGELEIVPGDPPPIRIEIPGRPVRPQLVHPQDLPRRGLHTLRGRQALLHAVTHIEFNAINLALDAVYRFRDFPAEYVSDWLQVAAEEARHFRLLAQRLTETGVSYGDFPAHNGLWEMAVKTDSDPMERMALVPRVLEARGLDVTPGMIQRLQAAGDAESVAVLRVIQREEVSHVAIGSQWFRHLAAQRGLEPEQTFLDLLALHMPGRVRPPFAMEARLAAGFSRREMQALEDQAAGAE
jgi:uncharacterized ferritin-like protein (DUF455 family)/glycerate-2-kinase